MNGFLKVTVESEFVEERKGNKNGKDWAIATQSVWAHFVDPTGVPERFPTKIQLTLDNGQKPYRPGEYIINPSSFYRGDYDRLSIRPSLVPVKETSKLAA